MEPAKLCFCGYNCRMSYWAQGRLRSRWINNINSTLHRLPFAGPTHLQLLHQMQHFTTAHDKVSTSTGNKTGLTLDCHNKIRQDSPDTIMEQKASQLQILVCIMYYLLCQKTFNKPVTLEAMTI